MAASDLILSIDTSDRVLGVEICADGLSVGRRVVDEPRIHAARLIPTVLELLDELEIGFEDIAAVAVAKGPGSYTGLRIGVSSAKGLCFALGIPLIGVPTLEALAVACAASGEAVTLVTCLTSRKGEAYVQVWQVGDGVKALTDAASLALSNVPEFLAKTGKVRFAVTGSAAAHVQAATAEASAVTVMTTAKDGGEAAVRGVSILAAGRYAQRAFDDVASFEPAYLKDFVAKKGTSPFAAARDR